MGKNNTGYFSHDSNAFNDIKIAAMRSDYGFESYGLYWVIIEMLRNTETYKLPLEKNTYRAIKIQTGTSIDIEKFINDCISEYKETENGNGLFNTDGHYFWSESLLRRMVKMEEVSAKRKKAGQRGARERWGKNQESKNDIKKKKIKGFITKNSKSIANAISFNSKCNGNTIANAIKMYGKCIAKNSKIKSKSKSKIKYKIKDMKSIYPSNHKYQENKNLDQMMDEIEKTEFERIIKNCELHILSPELSIEMQEILKEMYINVDTREKIQAINSKHLLYALKNFAIANTRSRIQIPKAYFKKCVLSALDQTELSQQYDTDTIYEMEDY